MTTSKERAARMIQAMWKRLQTSRLVPSHKWQGNHYSPSEEFPAELLCSLCGDKTCTGPTNPRHCPPLTSCIDRRHSTTNLDICLLCADEERYPLPREAQVNLPCDAYTVDTSNIKAGAAELQDHKEAIAKWLGTKRGKRATALLASKDKRVQVA